MEDELQKRNTDCVYFLASPLTCKKGSECEYRHSESARLNPRDCWYWLGGNCLNPTCAFRHPPLDGRTETSSDTVHVPPHLSVATSKTNVPCYFYFNAYCVKGESCPFLHGPNGVSSALKSTKAASAGADTHPLENKPSTGSDTGPGSVEAPPKQVERTSKTVNVQFQSKDVLQLGAPNNVIEHSPSPQISVPDCEEATGKLLNTPPPEAHFINSNRPLLCSDQSSEEPANECVEPDERWESSPGFDVLVDDGSEQLGYEDDPEYLLAHDRETGRRLHGHLLQYDYEDQVEYDHMDYPEILYEHSAYDSYDHLEKDHPSEHVRKVPDHSRERMLAPMMFQRRKLLPRELEVDGRNGVDLRDHLRKRKRDGHQVSRSQKRHSSHINDGSRERPVRRAVGRRLHGRLASEVGKNMIGSHSESESRLNGNDRPGRLRHSQSKHNRPRLPGKEKRRRHARQPTVLSSEISRGMIGNDTNRTSFTGPKTLAQIKEEKRRVGADEGNSRNTGNVIHKRTTRGESEDFQGPKPLRELIKDKRRLGSEHEHVELPISRPEMDDWHVDKDKETGYQRNNEKQLREDEFESVYDDDDDDDGLEKKLAGILA
ncbi:zinc finger CCCH domain-containing protein 34-like [Magnolia sinica]|uniref:zinc finger CCCH domain-containing protein 34-like n=1 Tax=Magnolia sinica TaxID=86752 RepID=UPI0026588D8E|nr:zinc finger CCCH domain-containing protein 34-like [Magnolia sinica]